MKGKSALMTGVAAVALVLSAQAGLAGKSASGSTSMPSSSASGVSQEQYNQLSDRVDAIENELQQSEVREGSDHDKVAGWKPMSGWWDNTTISGRMYFDFSNIENKNNGAKNSTQGTHFDLKRFYVSIDHKFNDTWSADVTTDVTYDSTQCTDSGCTASKAGASTTQVYIKKAYLQGKFDDALIVRAGSFDMPWIPFAEDVYGYRYVENTLVDRLKYGNSADWGFNVLGSFGSDLKFEYSLAAINGGGYKKPSFGLGANRSDAIDFEGRVDVKYDGFVLAVGGYDGKLNKETTPNPTTHTYQRFDAMLGYVANGFHVGVEYFSDKNFNNITSSATTTDSGDGWSGFGAYQFTPEWAVFGRYDTDNPTKGTAKLQPLYSNDYYNIGIEWTPVKIVNLSLVYKHDEGSKGSFGDSNGTIGGTSATTNGTYSEIGLFGQLRW